MIYFRLNDGAITRGADGTIIGSGYAGNGKGINNVAACSERDVGPLPLGTYRCGLNMTSEELGFYAIPLFPVKGNVMFGRTGFFCHGGIPNEPETSPSFDPPNTCYSRTASKGCLITTPEVRALIEKDGWLVVVA